MIGPSFSGCWKNNSFKNSKIGKSSVCVSHFNIFNCHIFLHISVADPGFSPGGCANSQNCYYFSNFCQKLHENERIWTPRGARVPGAPLRSANAFYYKDVTTKPQVGTTFIRMVNGVNVHEMLFILLS